MCVAGRPSVTLNGNKVSGWAFDKNNVLSFEMQAGFSAWLQFTVLPGGPLFLGTMAPSNTEGFISDKEFQVRIYVWCAQPEHARPWAALLMCNTLGLRPCPSLR